MSHPRKTAPVWMQTQIRHGVVWARLRYGRVFHAKLEDSATAAICGASPNWNEHGIGSRWWAYSKGKPPESALCWACVALIKQAEEEVTA